MAKDTEEENGLDVKFSKSNSEDRDSNHLRVDKGKHGAERRKSEEDDEEIDGDGNQGDERSESVVIPIEEDNVADAVDGKNAQKQSNTYAAKKTVAQGMMDIALITANANQLRFMLEYNRKSPTFYVNITLIIISLFLQVGVGVSLIFKGRLDLKGKSKDRNAKLINNYMVVGVFLVTIINVFIASFTVTSSEND